MAELVDAPASGAGVFRDVEVRVLFWAPDILLSHSRSDHLYLEIHPYSGIIRLWRAGNMQNSERITALQSFLDCSLEVAEALDTRMAEQEFGHKDVLVHQGDHSSQIWLVLAGSAQLQIIGFEGQVTLLATHGPGEIFGAFPEEAESNMDIKVYGNLTALQIASSDLHELLRKYPTLGSGLSKILGNQFNAVLDRLASHVTLTAKGRVYRELLRLVDENGRVSPPPVIAALALTAQTTRETASRAINAVVRRGIIERDASKFEIVSRGMLEELVF